MLARRGIRRMRSWRSPSGEVVFAVGQFSLASLSSSPMLAREEDVWSSMKICKRLARLRA